MFHNKMQFMELCANFLIYFRFDKKCSNFHVVYRDNVNPFFMDLFIYIKVTWQQLKTWIEKGCLDLLEYQDKCWKI